VAWAIAVCEFTAPVPTITGTFGGQSAAVAITVTATVTSLAVSAAATSLAVGATATVTATATYSDGTTATVSPTWSSSDTGVATVTTSGTVTGVAVGTATVTGTFGGQSDSVGLTASAATESGIGVVINEFRTRGPRGANDEFIELRNDSSANVNIGGWQVVGSNSSGATSVRRNIPSGIVLGVGCHYLLGNSNTNGYTGSTDTTYGVGITDTGGIALRKSDGTVMDQVGLSSGSAFKEGSPLPGFPGDNTNHSYSRTDVDTNNNLADFLMISPSTPKTSASSCVQ